MKLILKKDVARLGKAGEVVNVKEGYAYNFLIPQNLALEATENNLKIIELEKKKTAELKEKEKQEAKEICEKLANVSITVPVKVDSEGHLYRSVSVQDIVSALKTEGFEIDKRNVVLENQIKETGVFRILIKLHPEASVEVKVWVVKE
jgi:large subunit ribosomal protein L9